MNITLELEAAIRAWEQGHRSALVRLCTSPAEHDEDTSRYLAQIPEVLLAPAEPRKSTEMYATFMTALRTCDHPRIRRAATALAYRALALGETGWALGLAVMLPPRARATRMLRSIMAFQEAPTPCAFDEIFSSLVQEYDSWALDSILSVLGKAPEHCAGRFASLLDGLLATSPSPRVEELLMSHRRALRSGVSSERVDSPPAGPATALKQHIDENWFGPLRLNSWAQDRRVGERSLRRTFKSRYGLAPKTYQSMRRIVGAQAMLCEAHCDVQTIAYESGFYDHAQFSNCFKQIVGMSPTEYRAVAREA